MQNFYQKSDFFKVCQRIFKAKHHLDSPYHIFQQLIYWSQQYSIPSLNRILTQIQHQPIYSFLLNIKLSKFKPNKQIKVSPSQICILIEGEVGYTIKNQKKEMCQFICKKKGQIIKGMGKKEELKVIAKAGEEQCYCLVISVEKTEVVCQYQQRQRKEMQKFDFLKRRQICDETCKKLQIFYQEIALSKHDSYFVKKQQYFVKNPQCLLILQEGQITISCSRNSQSSKIVNFQHQDYFLDTFYHGEPSSRALEIKVTSKQAKICIIPYALFKMIVAPHKQLIEQIQSKDLKIKNLIRSLLTKNVRAYRKMEKHKISRPSTSTHKQGRLNSKTISFDWWAVSNLEKYQTKKSIKFPKNMEQMRAKSANNSIECIKQRNRCFLGPHIKSLKKKVSISYENSVADDEQVKTPYSQPLKGGTNLKKFMRSRYVNEENNQKRIKKVKHTKMNNFSFGFDLDS